MSRTLISRSPDLRRLFEEGYNVEILDSHLILRDVPYVDGARQVRTGVLVSELTLAGDATRQPSTHIAFFAGEFPCDQLGSPLERIRHETRRQNLGPNLVVDHSFSSKPPEGYRDYYHKMSTYAEMLAKYARAIDPRATAQTHPVLPPEDPTSVFHYEDTASARAGIGDLSHKLGQGVVAIVGLGGTGSYVLDLVSKTPVKEIHLFDGDRFLQHNAFRSPGAATLGDLQGARSKAEYWADIYSRMRKGVVAQAFLVTESNVERLRSMSFVFVCVDHGPTRRLLLGALESWLVPYVDVGMGVDRSPSGLGGILRVTSYFPSDRVVAARQGRVPFQQDDGDNAYSTNVQIADLNALNAALAVIRWKKHMGFYRDIEGERNCLYTIDGNDILNEVPSEQGRAVSA